jgi:putative peptidoglycan lipid II flippase
MHLKLLLAVGTTAGVVGMAAIPLLSVRRRGFSLRPRWEPRHPALPNVARIGAWGGVLLAAVQVLVGVTLVLANQVRGGVIAYQMAFTFFLLPIALAAHPVFTALYPRLATQAQAGHWPGFAADVTEGVRRVLFVVLPASAVLVAVGSPALRVLRMGELDASGARLVGRVLAAYALGLAGYGCFLLLARAWTAAGNARLPAVVAIGVTVVGSVLMVAGSAAVDGSDRVVVLGLAHSVAMTLGAAALFVTLRRHCGVALPIGPTFARSAVTAVAAGLAAVTVVELVDSGGRSGAVAALVAGLGVAGIVVLAAQWLLGAPELREAMRGMRGAA